MKFVSRNVLVAVILCVLLSCAGIPTQAQMAGGWQKITGQAQNYSGVTDGIGGDRQNSYAWSMAIHGDYLYCGTARNVVGLALGQMPTPPNPWPDIVPKPTDMRGRIYRLNLQTGGWEPFYTAVPNAGQIDMGYRMMKVYKAAGCNSVLYVGSMGFPACSMLAIDSKNSAPVKIFSADGMSVRAMAEYNGKFFWASEVNHYPTIWCSSDPLKEYTANPNTQYEKIEVPSTWFTGAEGAEIMDMVPYNGQLYVFFLDHNWDKAGFWCAKLSKVSNKWKWQLIVGDKAQGAKYPPGMGRPENGGATPYIFKNKMYVGTISTTMWRFLMTGYIDLDNVPPTGTQIFRFDTKDKWERVMPPAAAAIKPSIENALNGFANPLNLYLWRFVEHKGKLYAGTFDARTALEAVGIDLSSLTLWNPAGFDLYSTTDGVIWLPESLNGFHDDYNYGVRTLLSDPKTGYLYLGTANPFYGCQVWRKTR